MSSQTKSLQSCKPSAEETIQKNKEDNKIQKANQKKEIVSKSEHSTPRENRNYQTQSPLPQQDFEASLASTEPSQHKKLSKRSKKSKKQRSRQNFLSRERKRNRKYLETKIELKKLELQQEQLKFHNNCMETMNSGVPKFTIKIKRRDIKAQGKDENIELTQMNLKKEEPKKDKISLLDHTPENFSLIKGSEGLDTNDPFAPKKKIDLPSEDSKNKGIPQMIELDSDDYKLEEFSHQESQNKRIKKEAEPNIPPKNAPKLVKAPANEVAKIKIFKTTIENKAALKKLEESLRKSYPKFEEILKSLAKKHEFVVLKDFNKALSIICDSIGLSTPKKMTSKKEIFPFCHQIYSKLTDKEEQKKVSQTKNDLDKMGELLTHSYYINNQNLKLAAGKNRKKINQSFNRFVASFLTEKSQNFLSILMQKGGNKQKEEIEE